MIPTLDDVTALLYAAEKYEMPGALSYLRAVVMSPRFHETPIPVYGLCVRYNWKAESKMYPSDIIFESQR